MFFVDYFFFVMSYIHITYIRMLLYCVDTVEHLSQLFYVSHLLLLCQFESGHDEHQQHAHTHRPGRRVCSLHYNLSLGTMSNNTHTYRSTRHEVGKCALSALLPESAHNEHTHINQARRQVGVLSALLFVLVVKRVFSCFAFSAGNEQPQHTPRTYIRSLGKNGGQRQTRHRQACYLHLRTFLRSVVCTKKLSTKSSCCQSSRTLLL